MKTRLLSVLAAVAVLAAPSRAASADAETVFRSRDGLREVRIIGRHGDVRLKGAPRRPDHDDYLHGDPDGLGLITGVTGAKSAIFVYHDPLPGDPAVQPLWQIEFELTPPLLLRAVIDPDGRRTVLILGNETGTIRTAYLYGSDLTPRQIGLNVAYVRMLTRAETQPSGETIFHLDGIVVALMEEDGTTRERLLSPDGTPASPASHAPPVFP
ncbi:MAG: hypothetical protein HY403_06635 [Elusimicrobia bacterium]|nr:hypothetical protein [Elusimicrobiota bacterium]